MKRFVLVSALVALPVLGAVPAWAQIGGQNNAVSLRPKPEETLGAPRPVPPPALPGARASQAPAPASKPPLDMSPNDALFDAINRGDIATARDALNRGADLYSHNILGMTPMELSVDLGRNDISFLLLSMRGGSSGGGGGGGRTGEPPVSVAKASPVPTGRKAAPVKVAASAPVRAPVLFANDGGAPVPDAGFLGFDAGRGMR